MIHLTRLDGSDFVLNAELIETVQRTPDTQIHLVNGKHFTVATTVEDVVARVVAYRRGLMRGAWAVLEGSRSGPSDRPRSGRRPAATLKAMPRGADGEGD